MASLFLIAWLTTVPDVPLSDHRLDEFVDIIELHHGYDFRGNLAFKQLIFYRWSRYHRRFQIVDTVVVQKDSMLPKKNRNGFYCCRWQADGAKRIVKSLTFRETKSQTDPEIREREYLPIHRREGLKKTRAPAPKVDVRVSALPLRPERWTKN